MKKFHSVVISGSFRKHFEEIQAVRAKFEDLGVRVLSPRSATVRDEKSGFILLTTDETDDPQTLEKRHLEAIREATALYVVNPDGYLGHSMALEIGWATGLEKPVVTQFSFADQAIQALVNDVMSPDEFAQRLIAASPPNVTPSDVASNSEPSNDAKLKEYELCAIDANHLESVIWTTAGILITGSVAGIGLLGGTLPSEPRQYDLLFRIIVALLFLLLIWFWRRITSRWYSIQTVMYDRAMEIEAELGLYKERYVHWLKEAAAGRGIPSDPMGVRAIERQLPHYVASSVRRTVRWLTITLMLVWIVFLGVHLFAMLPSDPSIEAIQPVRLVK
ncbi:MAG: hypothetical protein QOF62_2782 [Pyrinomonadaceae bacterium]|jgi:hypothetical protein|nr:hypothetical protein [Pyrinomonadaceae bacterium]